MLGPLFAWSAHLGSVLVQLLLGINLILAAPMTPPKPLTMHVGTAFRVDAKAQGDTNVVGGWESFGGTDSRRARSFSTKLDRKTARAGWLY